MKIHFLFDVEEMETNIGIAKALAETNLSANDLQEIARYLLIFAENHPTEKGGEQE